MVRRWVRVLLAAAVLPACFDEIRSEACTSDPDCRNGERCDGEGRCVADDGPDMSVTADSSTGADGDRPARDGAPRRDGGARDGGPPPEDGAPGDGPPAANDTGAPQRDLGLPDRDAAPPGPDATPPDAAIPDAALADVPVPPPPVECRDRDLDGPAYDHRGAVCADRGTVVLWRFENTTAATTAGANDVAATCGAGVAYVPGQQGAAANMAGGQCVGAQAQVPAAWTLELWLYLNARPGQPVVVFSTVNEASSAGWQIGAASPQGADTALAFEYVANGVPMPAEGALPPPTPEGLTVIPRLGLPIAQWVRVAIILSAAGELTTCFGGDCRLLATNVRVAGPIASPHVGSMPGGLRASFSGRVDDVRLSSGARSPRCLEAAAGLVGCD